MHTRPTIFHLHHFRCSQTLCIMCIAHRFVKSFYGSWNYIRALSIEFAFQHFDPDLRKCHPNTVIATPQFMLQTVCVSVCVYGRWCLSPIGCMNCNSLCCTLLCIVASWFIHALEHFEYLHIHISTIPQKVKKLYRSHGQPKIHESIFLTDVFFAEPKWWVKDQLVKSFGKIWDHECTKFSCLVWNGRYFYICIKPFMNPNKIPEIIVMYVWYGNEYIPK